MGGRGNSGNARNILRGLQHRPELVLTTSAASYSSELNETGSQALRTMCTAANQKSMKWCCENRTRFILKTHRSERRQTRLKIWIGHKQGFGHSSCTRNNEKEKGTGQRESKQDLQSTSKSPLSIPPPPPSPPLTVFNGSGISGPS